MRLQIQYLFCIVFFWFLATSCERLTPDGYGQDADEFFKTQSPHTVIEDDTGHFTIIFGGDSMNVKGLEDFLHSYTSVRIFDNKSDSVVVVLGISDYEESQRAFREIDGFGFNVYVNDSKLIIVGSDETWTALALYALEETLMSDVIALKDSVLVIPNNLHIKYESKDPQLIALLIRKGYSFSLQTDFVVSCPGRGGCYTPQGVTCDGAFFYFILKNGADTQSIIFKHDMLSLKEVKHSSVLNTGHSNDMTFNPEIESLIVAHGMKQGNTLTMIDSQRLSVIDSKTINVGAGAITYNQTRKQYALSQGGTTLHFADLDFNILQSFSRRKMNGYTAQGMGCDDSFVYFPMSRTGKNILLAYDWEGNLASTLDLDKPYESESMFYADGDYYVCFNYNGASLYRITPVLSYHFVVKED